MSSREARLLLVDDDPSSIKMMSRMLAQYPDQRFATSGEAAIRLAREATPDLILMDVDMPEMTGFEACEYLKADPLLARIPIIFVTSHSDSASLQVTAWQNGAADFITKPVEASQLTARVSAQLRATQFIENQKRGHAAAHAHASPTNEHTPRLLIVDDDAAAIHILRHTLATMGDLHFATTGADALQLARRLIPDLILLDAHMPEVDGFDVCRALKAEAPFRLVPIVFVTRFSDPRYEMRALDLGAADFIVKPYTAAVLRARVRNLLELKRRTDAELQAVLEHSQQVSDARLADIVGAASDAIVTYNASGDVVLVNAAASRMFAIGHAQAIGSPAQALLRNHLPATAVGQSGPSRAVIMRANGTPLSVELSVSSVGDGPTRLTTVMLRDNTDRERLEAESHSRLEAETASRTKALMLSYIAHEMGNPLNSLLGFAELMVADADHPLAPAQSNRLERVVSSGRRLRTLLRDVMDIGRCGIGKLTIDLHSVDAVQCAQESAASASVQAKVAGVTLSCLPTSASSWVLADAARLHQCLVNLLTNAVKYNRAGGWAKIGVTGDSQEVAIAVSDNGIGMDALQCQHMFEPFNRLGRQGDTVPGAGLGLVITRQLVEAMNGHLRVDSEPNAGSSFTITLPRSLPGTPPAIVVYG